MTALNLLAVQNAPLLRELAKEGPAPSAAALARAVGRDESNVRKSIKILTAEGLVQDPMALTIEGEAQLAAIDRAEAGVTPDEPGSSPGGTDHRWPAQVADIVTLRHDQLLPDPANARRDWDSEDARADLDALREDIVQHGLLQNLVVRLTDPLEDGATITLHDQPPGTTRTLRTYQIVGGERRWRAIGLAISEDDWPADRLIVCRLLPTDETANRRAALAENLQRRDLNPIEKAAAFEGLVALGLSNQDIADAIGKTPEHVQQHRRLLQLDDDDQQRMTLPRDDPRRLGVRDARQKLARRDAEAQNEPEPLVLSPIARLTLAEIIHAVRIRAAYTYSDIAVGTAATDDIYLAELVQAGQVRAPSVRPYGPTTGHHVIQLEYGSRPPFDWQNSDDGDVRNAGVEAERQTLAEIAGTAVEVAEGAYVTAWLNPPFDRSPEGQAVFEQRQAEEVRQRDRQAAQDAAADERARRWAEARRRHLLILTAAQDRPEAGPAEDNRAIAEAVDHPLPWRLSGDAIVDAEGRAVRQIAGFTWDRPTDRDWTTAQLIVVGVNTAGGHPTPAVQTDADQDLDIDEFIAAMQALIIGGEPDATEILTTFLADNGIAFGDGDFNWSADGARQLVETFVETEDA